jgi:hypothetical protein
MSDSNIHPLLDKVVRFFNSDLWEQAGGDIGDSFCFYQLGKVVCTKSIKGDHWHKDNTVDIQYCCPVSGEVKILKGVFIRGLAVNPNLKPRPTYPKDGYNY